MHSFQYSPWEFMEIKIGISECDKNVDKYYFCIGTIHEQLFLPPKAKKYTVKAHFLKNRNAPSKNVLTNYGMHDMNFLTGPDMGPSLTDG